MLAGEVQEEAHGLHVLVRAEEDFGGGVPLADGVLDLHRLLSGRGGVVSIARKLQLQSSGNRKERRSLCSSIAEQRREKLTWALYCPSNPRSAFVYTVIRSRPARVSSRSGFRDVIGMR